MTSPELPASTFPVLSMNPQAASASPTPASIDGIFRALSDTTRRNVLERLSVKPGLVSDLAAPSLHGAALLPEHLKVLEGCGLVRSQKVGRVRTYEIVPDRFKSRKTGSANSASSGSGASTNSTLTCSPMKKRRNVISSVIKPDPKLDLVLERDVDVPVDLVWKAWTTPNISVTGSCRARGRSPACEIDLRPGGMFSTTMRSPEGQEFPNLGCYLDDRPQQASDLHGYTATGLSPLAKSVLHGGARP